MRLQLRLVGYDTQQRDFRIRPIFISGVWLLFAPRTRGAEDIASLTICQIGQICLVHIQNDKEFVAGSNVDDVPQPLQVDHNQPPAVFNFGARVVRNLAQMKPPPGFKLAAEVSSSIFMPRQASEPLLN